MQTEHTQLIRGLGLIAAISVNVANIIGTGVFLKARVMTCNVGTPAKALIVWVLAGLLAMAGALTYAELLAMKPRAAGEYGLIRDAYGRPLGFIYGWTQFLIARTASAAALAVGFAIFLNDLVGGTLKPVVLGPFALPGGFNVSLTRLQLVALLAIIITTVINCAAVRVSGGVASVLTGMKVILLIGVGLGAFFYSDGNWGNLALTNTGGTCEGVGIVGGGVAGFAAAMIGALWAYDGWNNITFLAGEVKNPGRNLPLALIGGGLVVMGLYLFVNVNYFHVLTPTEIASVPASSSVAAEVVRRLLGAVAVTLMAAAMMTSSFGALHASILATARIPYALAKDGLIVKSLAHVSPRTHVPIRALVVQCFWACVVALSGEYDTLTDYAIFALTLFYALVAASIFIFRRREPDAERPYRTWGYPVVPVLFLIVSVALILMTIRNSPRQSAIGLGLILLGVPVYWLLSIRKQTTSPGPPD
ncbi:MAG TPA: amino acid permease [Pyrinomonadaceae bacterium]|jgi:APA family basic amino acid/polyamine antiporter|nr:amino acid permease [Pyrinomonadaceae bacterium]